MDESKSQMLRHFFDGQKKRLRKCLAPSMQCDNPAIRSHTVQNSRVLELIANKGHVIGFNHRIDKKKGPIVELGARGRNEATTFTGLCADHDAQLFRPIDTREIDISRKEQLFLLAYRPVLRELHSTMDAAIKYQSTYRKRVEVGWDPEDQPVLSGIAAMEQMVTSWLMYRYKTELDQMLALSNFDGLQHATRLLEGRRPTVAVSSFFSIGANENSEDIQGVGINVLPNASSSTLVLVSYLPRDSKVASDYLGNLFSLGEDDFTYRLSRMILEKTETLAISPTFYANWSRGKRNVVEGFFRKTLFKEDALYHDSRLNLFSNPSPNETK